MYDYDAVSRVERTRTSEPKSTFSVPVEFGSRSISTEELIIKPKGDIYSKKTEEY
jgi:hypothetical protein